MRFKITKTNVCRLFNNSKSDGFCENVILYIQYGCDYKNMNNY